MTAGSRAAQADGRTRAATVVDDRRERILDAAETLFAEHGFRNVSVRDVAEAADITHPLIYYYWKSKDGLLAATLERSQRRITELPDDADRQRMAAAIARAALQHNRPYLLMLIRALLDGMPPSDWPGGFPAVAAIVRMATDGLPADETAGTRARVASAVAMLAGWVMIEDALLEMVGLTDADREQGRETLLACIADVLAPALGDG